MSSIISPSEGICAQCYQREEKYEQDHWDNFRKCGNAALMGVACKIDEAFQVLEDTENERAIQDFHRRRILCSLEFFDYVDDNLLTSASHDDVLRYKQAVRDFALQRTDEATVANIAAKCRTKCMDMSLIDLRAEFFQFWCGEDVLDWSFSQYFEIVMANVEKYVPHKTLISIMERHFQDILSRPVERMNQ